MSRVSVNPKRRRAALAEYTPAPCPVCGRSGQQPCRDEEGKVMADDHAARESKVMVDDDYPKGQPIA